MPAQYKTKSAYFIMRMEQLTALIHNFNTDCHKQYTKVSNYLGNRLDESLKEIERFYYSDFWTSRFRRRLKEEGFRYYPLELDCILGAISCLREDTKFKLFNEDSNQNGVSNKDTMIALNVNLDKDELNDSHINNIIMHEFGHRQYNQQEFVFIKYLNELTIGFPSLYLNQSLEEKDFSYFTNDNEIRQRIIPIVKEMYDNNWTAKEAYELSANLKRDDIKDIFTKDYIIDLLNNIL